MRQLKHHEQKLLKKVDFLSWKADAGMREVKVMRRYHVQERYLSVPSSLTPAQFRPSLATLDHFPSRKKSTLTAFPAS